MITRRIFLGALGGGLLAATSGGLWLYEKQKKGADEALAVVPVTTIISPAAAAASPQVTAHPIHFTDVSQTADLHWTFANGATGQHFFVESTGGGVALFDYDGDGLLDIFALQGGPLLGATGADRNFSTRSVLYHNNGDGTFTDVTDKAGLGGNLGYGQGVSVADFDNDGRPDLYITAYGGNRLFHNNGDGTFTDVTQKAGVADTHALDHPNEYPWPLTAAWGDYDNDGYLDLFVCHYVRWSRALNRPCIGQDGKPAYCRPQGYETSISRLYHNNGDGTFTDVSHRAGIDKVPGKSMGALWLDYDEDGWMDLLVTNDTMANFLLHNNRDGTFTDKGPEAGVAYSDQGLPLSGMGIGAGDYDRDGHEDLFVVNFSGETKSVYRNLGHGIFDNTSYKTHIGSTNLQFLGFGLECFDYDNDGWMDLIVGNGHVLDRMDHGTAGSSYAQSQQLFHNQHDGTFTDDLRSLGDLVQPRVTRGLALGDYDNDGDVDVLMVSQTGPLQLFRNDGGNQSGWITFRLEGVHCSRDAYGAKVTITSANGRQTRWLHSSTSYCSHSDSRLTFGLGDASGVTGGEIIWPGGARQKFSALPGEHFYWIRQGQPPVPDPRIHPAAPKP